MPTDFLVLSLVRVPQRTSCPKQEASVAPSWSHRLRKHRPDHSHPVWRRPSPVGYQSIERFAHSLRKLSVNSNPLKTSLADILQYANTIEIVYTVTIFCSKISILLQMLTLFGGAWKGAIHWITHVSIWTNLAFYIASGLAVVFSCVPRDKIWNPLVDGSCINVYGLIISSGALNFVSDLSMLILSIVVVFHLHLPLRKRLAICAVFAFGLM